MYRSSPALALAALLAAVLGVACGAPAPVAPPSAVATQASPGGAAPKTTATAGPSAAAKPSGTLRAGINAAPTTLDPLTLMTTTAGAEVGYAMGQPLFIFDAKSEVAPALAQSFTAPSDQLSWTVKLAPGRRFSNGDAVTPEDVKFSYDTFVAPANRYASAIRFATLDTVTVTAPDTLVFKTKTPDALLARRLTFIPIVSKKSYETITPQNFGTQAPASAGPFVLRSVEQGVGATVEANPNAAEMPRIQTIQFRGISEQAVRAAALRTGELDIVASLIPEIADQLRGDGKAMATVENFAVVTGILVSAGPMASPPTSDRRVREAMNIGIDRAALVKGLAGDYGTVRYSPVAEEAFGYVPLPPHRFDLPRARQLVSQAGFDGASIKLAGAFATGTGLTSITAVQAYAQAISATGLRIDIDSQESGVFRDRYANSRQEPFMIFPLASAFNDADGAIQNFRSTSVPQLYNNPAFDTAYNASTREFDVAKRRELLGQAVRVLYDDYVTLPIGSVPGIFAYDQRKLQDFKPPAQFGWNFATMAVR